MVKRKCIENTKCWWSTKERGDKFICPKKKDRNCPELCFKYLGMKWQMENCGLPKAKQKMQHMSITDTNEVDEMVYNQLIDIRDNILDFVQSRNNLYLCSKNIGNGKTTWAIKLLHTYIAQKCEYSEEKLFGLFISVPELLTGMYALDDNVQKEKNRRLLDSIDKIDLVVWDDVAITGLTQFQYLNLYTFINKRVFAEKSNIFTSNIITQGDLADTIGERIASRVWNTSKIIEFKGPDFR